MKIVIDLYDLGFKMHDLTEDEINIAVGVHPQYRERVYYWAAGEGCGTCPLGPLCNDASIFSYCRIQAPLFLQPYFKRR